MVEVGYGCIGTVIDARVFGNAEVILVGILVLAKVLSVVLKRPNQLNSQA